MANRATKLSIPRTEIILVLTFAIAFISCSNNVDRIVVL